VINVNTDYRCVVTCTHVNQTDTSNIVTVNTNVASTNPVSASASPSVICSGKAQHLAFRVEGMEPAQLLTGTPLPAAEPWLVQATIYQYHQ